MPEYVYDSQKEKEEKEKKYKISVSEMDVITRSTSQIDYIDSIIYADSLNQNKSSFPDTNYTQNQGLENKPKTVVVVEPKKPLDVDAVEDNNQLMEKAIAAAAQQDAASNVFDETLNAIAAKKFNAIIENDRKEVDEYLNSVKSNFSSQEEFDNYIKNQIKSSPSYKMYYQMWEKHYNEEMQKCVESANKEIEAHAKSDVISEFENKKVEVPVEELEVNKYVPKHISANMVADKNLTKTISGLLIDKLYNSLDESNDMYSKLKTKQEEIYLKKLNEIKVKKENLERAYIENIQKAETDKEKFKLEIEYKKNCKKLDQEKFEVEKAYQIFKFRNDLSEKLQHSHNKLYPKKTGVYGPAYKLMQRNIENHSGNMTEDAVSDLYLLKMKDEIIPQIAEKLALRVQEIILTNTKMENIESAGFNYDSKSVEKILERITDNAKLYETVVDANNAVNGKYEVAEALLTERKAMLLSKKNNEEFVYDAEKFANLREKLEENRQNNVGKMNETDYVRIVNALDMVENFEKKLSVKESINAEDVNSLKATFKDLEDVKELSKVEEKLNIATAKKLFGKNDGIQLVFDYLTADYIESASNAYVRGALNTFDYTQEDVDHDIEKTKEFLDKNNVLNPVITAAQLNVYSANIMLLRRNSKDEEEQKKCTEILNKLADCTSNLEDDEILQETGNPTAEDEKRIEENQQNAVEVINEVTDLLKGSKKMSISKDLIKDMNLGE